MMDMRSVPASGPAQPMLTIFREAGYVAVDPGILHDAAPFLDLGGEDIRASLYFTSDRQGHELCLRPEFTIPVCRAHLSSQRPDAVAQFSYCGPVFRFRAGEPDEFFQAGIESFGRADTAAADAEILSLALEAAAAVGARALPVTFGDAGLFARLLEALQLPSAWQRRLRRGLDKGQSASEVLATASAHVDEHAGVLGALASADAASARALVDDLLNIAGIASVGGRTAAEIADRFLAQVALWSAPPFGREQRAVLDRYLSVTGDPDAAAGELRALAGEARLDLTEVLDLFEERTSFMAASGIDLETVTYSAAFGRNLDYYTGFVFEVRTGANVAGPLLGGGRYDRLAQALGSTTPVPAVGVSIWLDRLVAAGQGI